MAFHPDPERVSVAWLKTVTGVPSGSVATTLPGDNSTWSASGFVQVTGIGGVPDPDTYMQASLIQVDCWASNTNSNKTPWGKALQLAMNIKAGLASAARTVTVGTNYNDAHVREVIVVRDPVRINNDPAGYAHYSLDIRIFWSEVV